ncbi:MaoC family dehydratase [Pseudomonas sp. gcc21]|uniref:MaoC family dehydratase n=1 Tax=Pseudomonas sp. gcc21 TaxID=2726989 RepID=UPI00145198BC|nr:MaoC family dehydratase [Pseudomonas sp. gcc21]QJD59888.1 MaoC family dehydratase [Pseudomonas sp. gcc21]
MRIINGISELEKLVGQEVGVSEWLEITQERINLFAEATGDHQWIHVDVPRAERESPMGGPIAHGFLTLSLLPMLRAQTYRVEGVTAGINYGLNRLRFLEPVLAGARIRARFVLVSVENQGQDRFRICNKVTIELEGSDRPACIAETLGLSIF